jgi:hypothetical protein
LHADAWHAVALVQDALAAQRIWALERHIQAPLLSGSLHGAVVYLQLVLWRVRHCLVLLSFTAVLHESAAWHPVQAGRGSLGAASCLQAQYVAEQLSCFWWRTTLSCGKALQRCCCLKRQLDTCWLSVRNSPCLAALWLCTTQPQCRQDLLSGAGGAGLCGGGRVRFEAILGSC